MAAIPMVDEHGLDRQRLSALPGFAGHTVLTAAHARRVRTAIFDAALVRPCHDTLRHRR